MSHTQDILDACVGRAATALPDDGSTCSAHDAGLYIAHTGHGASIRSLAAAAGCHPSTVLRTVRRIEARRDDPLFDRVIAGLEMSAAEARPSTRVPANSTRPARPSLSDDEVGREARKVLRRLTEPGAFLLVADGAERGGVFCAANGHTKPIALVPVRVAVEFLRRDWITKLTQGSASIRYKISDAGRAALKRFLAEDAAERTAPAGFADSVTPFRAQHQVPGKRVLTDPESGRGETVAVNLGESPLGWLARRKGPGGQAFLSLVEVDAGERLRTDFEMANIGPSLGQDWQRFLTAGTDGGRSGTAEPGTAALGARDRVTAALSTLGPGLSDVALRVCCFLEGLEACERRMGWSARSGKVVLKLALQRLVEHYGLDGKPRRD